MSDQYQSNKAIQATLIMATITLALAVFAVASEAVMNEEDAKAFVVPTLYALILTSGITITSGIAGVIHRNK